MQRQEARLGFRSFAALTGGYGRARRSGARLVGTEHVLVSLLLHFDGLSEEWSMLRGRLKLWDAMPELPGARAQDDGDVAGFDLEVDGSLREARWLDRLSSPVRTSGPGPGWHPGVRSALRSALEASARAGVAHCGPLFLLEAVLADPRFGAHELVRANDLEPSWLLGRARLVNPTSTVDTPNISILEALRLCRIVDLPEPVAGTGVAGVYLRRWIRRTGVDPMLFAIESEAARQAARLAGAQVTTAHFLLATLELDRQLSACSVSLPDPFAAVNGAGRILAAHGVDYDRAAWRVAELLSGGDESIPKRRPTRWWWRPDQQREWRTNHRNLPWALHAAEAAERAQVNATRRGTVLGSSHLLVAALADVDGPAGQVLRRLGVDPASVVDETHRHLSRIAGDEI